MGKPAQAYIQKRALSMDTVKRFGLGFSPDAWATLTDTMKAKGYRLDELIDAGLSIRGKNGGVYDRFRNRLMFPIIDIRGNVIGFGGRVMDDSTPKYLNSPETLIFNKRKNLFALNVARKSKQESHHPHRGLYGRHRPAPVRVRLRRGLARHVADGGAREYPRQVHQSGQS
ncbi:MAG: hypothetical protein ACLUFI_10510 [Oscillospiraceae bacterium]